jgi:FkbM family methyltransferase
MIRKLKSIIKNIVFSVIPVPYIPPSYSQAGEDAILRFLFKDYGAGRINYLEIGTNIPDFGNNTYLFYLQGSRGVCVEANSSLIDEINRVRPQDVILNAGVSVTGEEEADFYVFNAAGLSTFDKKEAENRRSLGNFNITKVVKVPLVHINDLIKDNFNNYPHLLSIDIEGLDLSVLQSLDFVKYPIPVICVETCTYSETHIRPKDYQIQEFLFSKGYDIYADTYINTIFVYRSWFHKIK